MKRTVSLIASLLVLHSSWGPEVKWLCNPVLSCHSCILAWFACPIGVFVHYSGYHLFPFFALGTVLLVGALVGRLLCGWVCPFGLVQDLLHKIPSPKFRLPAWSHNFKYLVLIFLAFLFPFLWGEDTLLSFCRYCPAAALQVTLPSLIGGTLTLSGLTIAKFSVLAAVLVFAVVASRSFCKTLCPIGAILAPLNYLSFWAIKTPREQCLACQKCDRVCSMDIQPSARILAEIPVNRALDCIVCHECQTACQSLPLGSGH